MAAKMAYNNQGVTIAIHGDDFKNFLEVGILEAPVELGGVDLGKVTLEIKILYPAQEALLAAFDLERETIAEVKRTSAEKFGHPEQKIVHRKMEEYYGKS